MKIGSLIKFHRTKLGMTQNELATGICSISHLSKIENNSKEGNSETIRLLLEKLNIQLHEVKNNEQHIIWLLEELQKHINYIEKEKAKEILAQLKANEQLIVFTDSIYLYELYKLRYYVFINDNQLAEKQLNWLNNIKKNFSQHEKYLHLYFSGLVLLLRGEYVEAENELTNIVREYSDLGVFQGDLYYHLAIVKGRLEESSQAIIYGRKALEIYKNEFNFKRILNTLLSLAINYTRGKVFKDAIEIYGHLLRNVDLLGQQHLLPEIYHNLGILYQRQGDYVNSITCFEKSVFGVSKKNEQYLVCLYNLAYSQYQIGRYEESKKNFVHLKRDSKKIKIFYRLANFYLHLLEDNKHIAMVYLEKDLIPYISRKGEYKETYVYFSNILSDYYLQEGKYEKALQFNK